MTLGRSIVFNGDLGSGKSAVSKEVAKRLGLRRVSMGDVHREMAQQKQMTTLQLNRSAERDEAIDNYVDELQREIARSGERLVVDSRLGWHFFLEAFKVHLVADPTIAAQRVLARPATSVEQYASLDDAVQRLRQRSQSERDRFIRRYGVDKYKLRNYDLVCDTTTASKELIADLVVEAFTGSLGSAVLRTSRPLLLLDPANLYPTDSITTLRGMSESEYFKGVGRAGPRALEPLSLGYADRLFYVLDGHRRLSTALTNGFEFVPARLSAEGNEEVVGGITAVQFFKSSAGLSKIYDWDEFHQVDLPLPPHVLAEIELASPHDSGRR